MQKNVKDGTEANGMHEPGGGKTRQFWSTVCFVIHGLTDQNHDKDDLFLAKTTDFLLFLHLCPQILAQMTYFYFPLSSPQNLLYSPMFTVHTNGVFPKCFQ